MYMHNNHCHRVTGSLAVKYIIIIIIIIIIYKARWKMSCAKRKQACAKKRDALNTSCI